MKVLAIETSTARQSVALVDDGQVLASAAHVEAGSHTRWLLPAIHRLFERAQCRVEAVDGFVVSHGPGSFTGVRVGLSTVLGLRAVTGRPMITVGTLEAMAWAVRDVPGPICPIVPCRKGEVYWAQFEWKSESELKTLLEPQVGPPEAVERQLQLPTWVLGEGWLTSADEIAPLRAAQSSLWREVPEAQQHPSAIHVATLGIERFRRGEVSGEQVSAVYVQRAEAELKFGQHEGKAAKILRGEGKAPRSQSRSQ